MYNEPQKQNDLFFLCSLIEYISRKTKNQKKYVVKSIGIKELNKIYELAEVYHSENIEKISDEIIEKAGITDGNYDIISKCEYRVPSYWEIGRVYQRLILMLDNGKEDYINKMYEVLTSWIIEKIDNYNSSMYYENPDYIYQCYLENTVL